MSYETDSLVYPGVYMPLYKDEEVKEELRHINERDIIMAAVNVIELADAFKVEIVIPGVKREDFLIHTYGNIVSVNVLQKEMQLNNKKEKKHCVNTNAIVFTSRLFCHLLRTLNSCVPNIWQVSFGYIFQYYASPLIAAIQEWLFINDTVYIL